MTCIDPNCDGSPIKRPEHSTLMYDVYFCSGTKHRGNPIFSIPTIADKLVPFAAPVIAIGSMIGLGLEIDHTSWFDGGGS